jgi:hypothetical protein
LGAGSLAKAPGGDLQLWIGEIGNRADSCFRGDGGQREPVGNQELGGEGAPYQLVAGRASKPEGVAAEAFEALVGLAVKPLGADGYQGPADFEKLCHPAIDDSHEFAQSRSFCGAK